MPPDVLVDLTPLDTGSRYRGIGRYVSALAASLAALPPDAAHGLRFAGLTSLATGHADATLAYAGDPRFRQRPFGHRIYEWRRRLLLGGAARRSGARLLHHTDPGGTPWFGCPPRVVTCYDLIPLVMHREYLAPVPGGRARRRARDRVRYGGALRVLAISAATRDDLVQHVGIDPARIDVTHLGVDHTRFHPRAADGEEQAVRRALGVTRPFLLYVGAWDARKNLEHLVAAYARSGVRGDVALVLAGMLGPRGTRRVQAAIAEHGVGDDVLLPGYVDEALVPAAYRSCLAHVFPSLYEGFGLPVVEALACGAPTVTTRRSSLGEVAGDAALLVDGTDVDETAAALARVASDAALRDDLRARGRARAAAFTWDACARATVEAYVRALAAVAA